MTPLNAAQLHRMLCDALEAELLTSASAGGATAIPPAPTCADAASEGTATSATDESTAERVAPPSFQKRKPRDAARSPVLLADSSAELAALVKRKARRQDAS